MTVLLSREVHILLNPEFRTLLGELYVKVTIANLGLVVQGEECSRAGLESK